MISVSRSTFAQTLLFDATKIEHIIVQRYKKSIKSIAATMQTIALR